MYSKGVNQYLTIPANTNFLFYGDYTIECWVYFVSALNSDTDLVSNADGNNQPSWIIMMASGGTIQFYPAGYSYYVNSGITPTLGQWYHIAAVRSGTTTSLYVNGVLSGSPATSQTAATYGSATKAIHIYSRADGNNTNPAYIADVRITNGVAIYKSNFVPPTTPLTNYSTTYPASLLLNFTNGGIIDQHGTNVLETVGNAQLSTVVKKYGNASMYFDGTGDSLRVTENPNINLGSGDFTLECWVYFNVVNAEQVIFSKGWQSSSAYASYLIYMTSAASLRFGASSSGGSWDIASERVIGTMTAGSWIHIAVTRSGTSFRAFVNGVINDSFTFTSASSLANIAAQTLFIGGRTDGSSTMNGYIDDLRITKGVARYTTTFTPSASAFLAK
jgi:hypothetical protein